MNVLDGDELRSEVLDAVAPEVSVVIATFNRGESVARLLGLLGRQTLAPTRFEVIVVDDESDTDVATITARLALPYRLLVLRQANGGPAVARHAGIVRARASLIVVLDDDMIVEPGFLSAHVTLHSPATRRVVLGRLRAVPGQRLQLFERMQLTLLDRLFENVAAGRARPSGKDMYTGNVSFRRDDYLAVGGFDASLRLSEDADLGIRLERSGVDVVLSDSACAWHASDHASVRAWMHRSVAYGEVDATIARKHGISRTTDVWRYLFLVHPISRPFLLASAAVPALMKPVAWSAMLVAMLLGRIGLERPALAGATFAYGNLYFMGIRREAGTLGQAISGLLSYLRSSDESALGIVGRVAKRLTRSPQA